MPQTTGHPPELQVSEWLNTPEPLSLAALRGQVVVVHAFQMLCPRCVAHHFAQAKRLTQVFAGRDLTVIGLHTVFEHHAVMTPAALRVFLHEYRIGFPVGIDMPGEPRPDAPHHAVLPDGWHADFAGVRPARSAGFHNQLGRWTDVALGALVATAGARNRLTRHRCSRWPDHRCDSMPCWRCADASAQAMQGDFRQAIEPHVDHRRTTADRVYPVMPR